MTSLTVQEQITALADAICKKDKSIDHNKAYETMSILLMYPSALICVLVKQKIKEEVQVRVGNGNDIDCKDVKSLFASEVQSEIDNVELSKDELIALLACDSIIDSTYDVWNSSCVDIKTAIKRNAKKLQKRQDFVI